VNIEETLRREGITIMDGPGGTAASPAARPAKRHQTAEPTIDPDEAKLLDEIARLREEERSYSRSLGFHVEDAHARVDALVATARSYFEQQFASAGRIPDAVHHQLTPALAQAFVLSSEEFATRAHAATDSAAKAGVYDTTPRKQVEGKLAKFKREIASRRLALERRRVAARLEREQAALDDLDRRASEALDS
jgi:hypothetical protein